MESNVPKKVLTKKDITSLGFRATLLQSMFNYERMQSGGWLIAMLPQLQKIYKDDEEGLKDAMKDHLDFINTSPPLVGMLMGIIISLEEAKAPREMIKGLKTALFGPLAGIGDSLFWFTYLPIVAGISASFAKDGNIIGPIFFFLAYLLLFFIKVPLTHLGYNAGTKSIETLSRNAKKIGHASLILGVTVVGALIPTYVKITLLPQIAIGPDNIVNIQTDLIDTLLPNLLPLLYTLLMFYFLKVKQAKPAILILVTFLGAIALSFLGIL